MVCGFYSRLGGGVGSCLYLFSWAGQCVWLMERTDGLLCVKGVRGKRLASLCADGPQIARERRGVERTGFGEL